jgi:hypothetical protein
MGRKFKYDLSPERIEELFQTEMSDEARNIWSCCIEWLVNYFHCSKQLADVRLREWNQEYQHNPMKTVGLTSVNKSTKGSNVHYSKHKHGTQCFDGIVI